MANTKKWAAYYRLFGCVCCGKKDRPYGGNGSCDCCHAQATQGLKAIAQTAAATA